MTMQHDVKVVYTESSAAMVDVLLTEISHMDPPNSRTQSTKTGE
jgi:hypothetical protein